MEAAEEAARFDWAAPEIALLVRAALAEDLGRGDRTTDAIVSPETRAGARILAKRPLVLAGLPLAERVFRELDPQISFRAGAEEGARLAAGTMVAEIAGRARAILSGERTALNFLAHLSGVATLTRECVDLLAGSRTRLRDTRKTTPLLRRLEKYAVRMGGGTNHRFALDDGILIKENHAALAGGIGEAVRRALPAREPAEMTAYESFRRPRPAGPLPIEVEVRNEAELREALAAGAQEVLLDNLPPEEAARLVRLARSLQPECVIEISGGLTLANLRAYAETGADFLSLGALTHSAPAADLSLLVESPRLK
jgi:nicotinate-nucleotide pyrophosphorylase (carboxylating)